MKSKENPTISYPQFINNKPCGIDKFKGGSQERLAKSIALHFKRNDSEGNNNVLPRIIGLEGSWGSGKSNVVQLLKYELSSSNSYHFFEYDAWGYQEDLQRRSILEMLTEDLIKAELLVGKTWIKIKGKTIIYSDWTTKLDYLLARKKNTISESYPTLNAGVVAASLAALLTPISAYLAYIYSNNNSISATNAILITLIPFIVSLVVWLIACVFVPQYRNISYLIAIRKNKIKSSIDYEIISEEEPSVRDFRSWMHDVSTSINGKKLVIVFDNMDRLPAEKVKELWSLIHTFFAEEGFENIWAIIPFDQKHLSCAFGEENKNDSNERAQYFIDKTFPIVYRVVDPIITDYKELIDTLFTEAFGDTHKEEEFDIINRIYRIIKPKANIREIIAFTNELVALEMQREGEDIQLLNMAIFILHRDIIAENPIGEILSGKYLKKIDKIVSNNKELQDQMAALEYGVDIKHAGQITLAGYIEECFFGEHKCDINDVVDAEKFDIVLEDAVESLNVNLLDCAIIHLDGLKTESLNMRRVNAIWEHLANQWFNLSNKGVLGDDAKALLKHTTGTICQSVIDVQCSIIKYPREFDGAQYYKDINELDEFIAEHNVAGSIKLTEYTVEPCKFLEYIEVAKDNYKKYKLNTNKNDLDSLLVSRLADDKSPFDYYMYIPMLIEDGYTFEALLNYTRRIIDSDKINKDNCKSVIYTYKAICDSSPELLDAEKDRMKSILTNTKLS